jgi:peptidyl-dipeptidase Dcp
MRPSSVRRVGTAAFASAVCLLLAAAARSAPPPDAAKNPLFEESKLPFQAPPFDKLHDSDYAPAIEEGMKQQLAEINAVAENPEAPTFANTIEAMERSGQLLTRAAKIFFNLAQSNTNDTMQKIRAEEAPKLAAHQDAVFLNGKLFARVQALYEKREALHLDPQAAYLLERYELNFVRAGAKLSEADKTTLRGLNKEEATLSTQFADKLLADTNAGAIVVDDKTELEGLSEEDLAAAAEAAKLRKLPGKWVLALQNTTQQPLLSSLANRALRARLLKSSEERCSHGGDNDTRAIATRLAQLRAQKAKLLGFPDYASYVLDDQMAKTPSNAFKLMTDMVPAAVTKAKGEAAAMQKLIDAAGGGFQLAASDWEFYAEKVRKVEFDLDESEVKPYFDLDRVLQDGVFHAARELYGITFKERKDIPIYQPDVRVWEVFDADGKSLAIYYGDYFARPNKSGGAWEDSFVDPSGLLNTKPVVFNVTNFTKPAPGQPALLSFDDVKTIFHEFGHALHGMFIHPRFPTLSAVPRDFVEFPSQFNEHWALEPAIFAHYARHYQTGKPMPPELVEKIKKSRTFNQGYATVEYLAAALTDMAWHTLLPSDPLQDVGVFEPAALRRFQIDLPQVPPRYHTPYFAHIWGGGYSAGYYAYLWSEVIDDDAYYWFKEHGGLTRANGQRFRDQVLSRAGTMDSAALYRAFRGRDPVVEPLLEERGLKPSQK